MSKVTTIIRLYGKYADYTPTDIHMDLLSFGYSSCFKFGDFYIAYDSIHRGEFSLLLFIYNESMLEDNRVKELLLEYLIKMLRYLDQ